MRAHRARNPAPCAEAAVMYPQFARARRRPFGLRAEVRADNLAVFFRHEDLMFGGAPVRECSFLIACRGAAYRFHQIAEESAP